MHVAVFSAVRKECKSIVARLGRLVPSLSLTKSFMVVPSSSTKLLGGGGGRRLRSGETRERKGSLVTSLMRTAF
jgi:hypothetical protein